MNPVRFFAATLAAVLLLCGCKSVTTTIVNNRVMVAYNPVTRLFSSGNFDGPPFPPQDIVRVLRKAGVPPEVEIRVNMRRLDNPQLMAEVTVLLEKGGYMRYTFHSDPVAESQGSYFKPLDKTSGKISPYAELPPLDAP